MFSELMADGAKYMKVTILSYTFIYGNNIKV